jgi:hypothetical protein
LSDDTAGSATQFGAPATGRVGLVRQIDPPKHACRFAGAGSIEQCVRRLIVHAVAEADAPEAHLCERGAVRQDKFPEVTPGIRIERFDCPVTKVPDQHVVAERTEVGGCLCHAPRCIQCSTYAHDLFDEVATGIELVQNAKAYSGPRI